MDPYIYKMYLRTYDAEKELGRKLTDTEWAEFTVQFEAKMDAAAEMIFDNLVKELPPEIW